MGIVYRMRRMIIRITAGGQLDAYFRYTNTQKACSQNEQRPSST